MAARREAGAGAAEGERWKGPGGDGVGCAGFVRSQVEEQEVAPAPGEGGGEFARGGLAGCVRLRRVAWGRRSGVRGRCASGAGAVSGFGGVGLRGRRAVSGAPPRRRGSAFWTCPEARSRGAGL